MGRLQTTLGLLLCTLCVAGDAGGEVSGDPIENLWHQGSIAVDNRPADRKEPAMRWTNYAGASWRLEPDLARAPSILVKITLITP
jgi:hypothetical protein